MEQSALSCTSTSILVTISALISPTPAPEISSEMSLTADQAPTDDQNKAKDIAVVKNQGFGVDNDN